MVTNGLLLILLSLLLSAQGAQAGTGPVLDELEVDLEAEGVVLPPCLNQSYYHRFGWSTYANYTASKREIILEADWWDSSLASTYVFAYVLKEILGYKLNFKLYGGGKISGERLNHGTADIVLELWQSDATTWYSKFVQIENTVVSYGSVGYSGRVGLYFPSYLLESHPQLDTLDYWRSLTHKESQALFPRFGTAVLDREHVGCTDDPLECVDSSYLPKWYTNETRSDFFEIWYNDLSYTPYYFNRLIDGLGLNASIRFLGDQAYTTMQAAYDNRQPFLYYNWRPSVIVAGHNFTRVLFPDDSKGHFARFQKNPKQNPVDVDLPVEVLFKASSSKWAREFPELGYFLAKFGLTDETINDMLGVIGKVPSPNFDDVVYSSSACQWLRENEDVWETWIPDPPKQYDVCPRGTGRYLSDTIWVCLTCPPGTFNLNETTAKECDTCLYNTICPGADHLNVAASYWIPEIHSNASGDYELDVHSCPYKNQCCPKGNCSSDAICKDGFSGILCYECSNPDLYVWNGECISCNGFGVSFYLALITPFLITAALLCTPTYHAAELEQLFFYFQVVNLIFEEDVGKVIKWNEINKLLALFSLNIDELAIHCPVPLRGIDKQLYRFKLPMLILFSFLFYYCFLKAFPRLRQYLPKYMAKQNLDVLFVKTFTIVLSFVLMPLIEAALALLNCDLVHGVHVLYYVPTVECFSAEHIGPAVFAGIVLLVVLVLYPLGLLILLAYLWKRKRIVANPRHSTGDTPNEKNTMDRVYQAFYVAYRPQFFYMESVLIWERAAIVMVFTFLNHQEESVASLAFLAMFAVFCFTRIYIQPFKKHLQVYLNREIGIGFLVLLAFRQYAKHEPEGVAIRPFVILFMLFPVVCHTVRWIQESALGLKTVRYSTSTPADEESSQLGTQSPAGNERIKYTPVVESKKMALRSVPFEAALCGVAGAFCAAYAVAHLVCAARVKKAEDTAKSEREGRIRIQIQLSKLKQRSDASSGLIDGVEGGVDVGSKNGKKDAINSPFNITLSSVGAITSPYSTRNGTPRQPSLVSTARARLSLHKHIPKSSLIALKEFSHAWIIFVFHQNTNTHKLNLKGTIKPPRLNGQSVGVFSTRSPHRPAPIGLSLARIAEVNVEEGWVLFHGLDLVHGTPILDIKPFVAFSDVPESLLIPASESLISSDFNQHYAPSWVTREVEDAEPLAVANVAFQSDTVELGLRALFQKVLRKSKKHDGISLYSSEDAFVNFIIENLSLDFRSTRERADPKFMQYRVTLCDIVIHYHFVNAASGGSVPSTVMITGAEVVTDAMRQPLNEV
ncbi:hypothetical protein HDU80_007258 [Chytriomyces hyalinus]|nr:hypothetical protein HDU80_007258 [Chytriomyces hyalinus]